MIMPTSGLISRSRLKWIPKEARLSHEYSFFLHDQCVQLLKQYEEAKAHLVTINFKSDQDKARFLIVSEETNSLNALRSIGYAQEARRVVLNTITIGLVSDCMHHVYEALKCLEKRKVVVALNLLRKPLMDSLVHLSWMLGDEDAFYVDFTQGDPELLAAKRIRPRVSQMLSDAITKTKLFGFVRPEAINAKIFDKKNHSGLYAYFQHAVHLITVGQMELKTSAENFNFIFKSLRDDDVYGVVYSCLPEIMLYLSNVIFELFDRMQAMEPGAKTAFIYRARLGAYLANGGRRNIDAAVMHLRKILHDGIVCHECGTSLKITVHNAARITLSESARCSNCGRLSAFPFSYIF